MIAETAAAFSLRARLFGDTQKVDIVAGAPSRDEVERMLRGVFECSDAEMWRLTVDAYHDCVLGKLRPAEPPLEHAWLVPGGVYEGQWVWDTVFVSDLLSYLPGQRDTLRGVYQNYWDFQQRWNRVKPAYAHGMIANYIAPLTGKAEFNGQHWETYPAYSQAPLIAWGVERIWHRTGDMELVRAALAPLEAFHEWYWRERDLDDVGMVCVGSYDGTLQCARYETYDNEVDLDSMKMRTHPKRPAGENGLWYGNILIPANTAYLLLAENSLATLARAAGNRAMARRREQRLKKGLAAMREHMWDEERGCFMSLESGTMKKLEPVTVGGFVPLFTPVPTKHQAARMAQALTGKDWATPLPVPTVAASATNYNSHGFWRGDVWPPTNYQVALGLAQHGHRELAARIADLTIDNAMKAGISEHYDSQSGKPLGVPGLGMSALVITLALDGVSARRRLRRKS